MDTIIIIACLLCVADAVFLDGAIIINKLKKLIGK
jgi:hypothetical protein